MLSVDGRLIVRRAAAVRAAPGGKRRQVQVEEQQQQQQAALRPQHRRKHTLCSTQRVSPARRPQCCRCTRLHGTDWHTRRSFTFNGLFGMHSVVKYRLGSVYRAPKEGDVKRMKGQDPANYWKQAKRENFNSLRGMLHHFGGWSGETLLGFCLWFTLSILTINLPFFIFLKVKFTVTKWFNLILWRFLISLLFCVICMDFIILTWLLFKMAMMIIRIFLTAR